LPGAEQALVTGLVFGTIYAVTGRLWMVMVAHGAFDLTALWMIYWNLEGRIAHLVFK
jgi:membrane protease YdiL (CAAX protease family)